MKRGGGGKKAARKSFRLEGSLSESKKRKAATYHGNDGKAARRPEENRICIILGRRNVRCKKRNCGKARGRGREREIIFS